MNQWTIYNLPYIYFEISDYQDYQDCKRVLMENFFNVNNNIIVLVQQLLVNNPKILNKTAKKLEFMYESLKSFDNPFLGPFDINEFISSSDIQFLKTLLKLAKKQERELDELLELFENLNT